MWARRDQNPFVHTDVRPEWAADSVQWNYLGQSTEPIPCFPVEALRVAASPPRSSTPRSSLTRFPPACLLPGVAPESRQPPACFSACGSEVWLVRQRASPAWLTEARNARPRGSHPRPAWPGQPRLPTLADLLPQVLPRRLGDLRGRHEPFWGPGRHCGHGHPCSDRRVHRTSR